MVGDVKFGDKGEWDKARILTVQFQNIKGTSVDDFRDGKGEVVLWPDQYKAGDVILPYTEAKKIDEGAEPGGPEELPRFGRLRPRLYRRRRRKGGERSGCSVMRASGSTGR